MYDFIPDTVPNFTNNRQDKYELPIGKGLIYYNKSNIDKIDEKNNKVNSHISKFDKIKKICYIYSALKRKSNFNDYTSESGIVETDYKNIVKEHL